MFYTLMIWYNYQIIMFYILNISQFLKICNLTLIFWLCHEGVFVKLGG